MMTTPMEINVLVEKGFEGCLEVSWLKDLTKQVLIAQDAGTDIEMGLVIAGQKRIQQLNKTYLGRDEPTDVLAFAMLPARGESGADFSPFATPPDGVLHLGEVIISYPQAVKQAEEHQHSIKKELAILVIHGVLHLLGYEHDKPELERLMSAKETEILNRIEGRLD